MQCTGVIVIGFLGYKEALVIIFFVKESPFNAFQLSPTGPKVTIYLGPSQLAIT